MSSRPHIYYGLCEGGPWHRKHLADARDVFVVFVDQYSKKPIVGAVAGHKGGEYRFSGGNWVWYPPPNNEIKQRFTRTAGIV